MEDELKEKTDAWRVFIDTGMLWWVNRILHTFGWSIVVEEDETTTECFAYPMRTTHLGFSPEVDDEKLKAFQAHIEKQ